LSCHSCAHKDVGRARSGAHWSSRDGPALYVRLSASAAHGLFRTHGFEKQRDAYGARAAVRENRALRIAQRLAEDTLSRVRYDQNSGCQPTRWRGVGRFFVRSPFESDPWLNQPAGGTHSPAMRQPHSGAVCPARPTRFQFLIRYVRGAGCPAQRILQAAGGVSRHGTERKHGAGTM